MPPDSVKISLESIESSGDYTYEVSLRIYAYLTEGEVFDKNTIEFHCDPKGSNYDLTFLRVVFDDWSKVVEIRDFLDHHFSDSVMERQTKTIEIADGVYTLRPVVGEGHELENLDEFTISASGDRIEFGRTGSMTPYFHTYEKIEDDGQADTNNADKILDFFDELIARHPTYETNKKENPKITSLVDNYRVGERLNSIAGPDSSLFQDYQKAVREFEDEEFEDSIRDIGRAAETLIKLLSENIYEEENIPSHTGGRLDKLDKTEDGVPAMIGKTISPLWWLRNRVNHPSEYEVTKEDAHYALLCFQTGLEKYTKNILNEEE
jgi:hypothetical protein